MGRVSQDRSGGKPARSRSVTGRPRPAADVIGIYSYREGRQDGPGDQISGDRGLFGTQVPNGRYLIGYVGHERTKRWKRDLYDVAFQILEPLETACAIEISKCAGLLVPHFVNRPEKPRKGHKASLRSTFALDFRRIVKLLPPRDLHRLDPKDVYAQCTLEAEIAAILKDSQGVEVPESARYSAVRKITRRVDGSPPYLQRRSHA